MGRDRRTATDRPPRRPTPASGTRRLRSAAVDLRARDLVLGESIAPDVDEDARVVGAVGAGEGDALGVRGAAAGDSDLLFYGISLATVGVGRRRLASSPWG